MSQVTQNKSARIGSNNTGHQPVLARWNLPSQPAQTPRHPPRPAEDLQFATGMEKIVRAIAFRTTAKGMTVRAIASWNAATRKQTAMAMEKKTVSARPRHLCPRLWVWGRR